MPASRMAKSADCEEGNFCATYSSKSPVKPGLRPASRPGRERPGHGGVEQAHLGEVRRQLLDLDQEARGLAGERAAEIFTLTSAHWPLPSVATAFAASLPGAKSTSVVVGLLVVGRVEDVGVEPVLVRPEVEHPQPHFLRRAVGLGNVGPAGRIDRRGAGKWRLSRKPGRVIELQAERRDEIREVVGADVVRGHAPAREEVAVVDGGPVDGRAPAARPFDLRDLLPAALGSLREGLRLEHARVERGGAAGEGRAVDVEGVVGRAGDGRPRARRQAVPARRPCSAAPGSAGRCRSRWRPSSSGLRKWAGGPAPRTRRPGSAPGRRRRRRSGFRPCRPGCGRRGAGSAVPAGGGSRADGRQDQQDNHQEHGATPASGGSHFPSSFSTRSDVFAGERRHRSPASGTRAVSGAFSSRGSFYTLHDKDKYGTFHDFG